jgi:spore coat protein H
MRPFQIRVLCASILSLYAHIATVRSAEWQSVFDPFQVITIHLQMDSNDWERVRHDQPSQNESWVPEIAEALFWAEGETPLRVTVRRKGESDIPLPEGDPQKVSLKIDINELLPGQKWRGLTKLSLENGSDNPLTEGFAWIAHRLAWETGIYGYEAAYSGWVRLYINGDLKGVFLNAEQRNAQFLRNHGYENETATWLYKVDGSSALEVGVGDSPANRHLCYAPFNSGPGGGGGGGCRRG